MAGIAVVLFLTKRTLRRLFGPRDAAEKRAAVRIAPLALTFLLAIQAIAIVLAFEYR